MEVTPGWSSAALGYRPDAAGRRPGHTGRRKGVVLFAHGSGSGRLSPLNRLVAAKLQQAGLATLLLDLLTAEEETAERAGGRLRLDVQLLAGRLAAALDRLATERRTGGLPVGLFGASTGAGAEEETVVITRMWRGWTLAAQADRYVEHYRFEVVATLRQVPGFRGARLLLRPLGEETEFVSLTFFDDLEAVRGFAGADYETAVVAEDARKVLIRFDERVAHYETAFEA